VACDLLIVFGGRKSLLVGGVLNHPTHLKKMMLVKLDVSPEIGVKIKTFETTI